MVCNEIMVDMVFVIMKCISSVPPLDLRRFNLPDELMDPVEADCSQPDWYGKHWALFEWCRYVALAKL
jgi:hypothetical protein